jgi:hypothetical protein
MDFMPRALTTSIALSDSVGKSLFAGGIRGGLDLAARQRVEDGGLAAVGESDNSDLHGAEYSTGRGKRETADVRVCGFSARASATKWSSIW